MRRFRHLWVLFALVVLAPVALGCQVRDDPQSAAEPAESAKPASTAEVSEEAQRVLNQMRDAYAQLESLELSGNIKGNFDVAGREQQLDQQLTGSFKGPYRFRHEVADEIVVGSTGEMVYMYNPSANAYFRSDVAEGEPLNEKQHGPVLQLLQTQNPGLLFAVVDDPLKHLLRRAKSAERLPDEDVEGVAHPTIAIQTQGGDEMVLIVDPKTHLLRELRIDLKQGLQQRDTPEVKQAELAIRYNSVAPGASYPADHFSWLPPVGAKNVAELRPQQIEDAQEKLIGKPAPEFTLSTLDGEEVTLSDLKGQTVVLDFWATWCPPCVESLPHLGKLYRESDQDELAVFAVNVSEDSQTIKAFLETNDIDVPVLLDRDNEVAESYFVGSIPQTVIVGPDGVVQRVYVGLGADTYDEIQDEVEKLLRQVSEEE